MRRAPVRELARSVGPQVAIAVVVAVALYFLGRGPGRIAVPVGVLVVLGVVVVTGGHLVRAVAAPPKLEALIDQTRAGAFGLPDRPFVRTRRWAERLELARSDPHAFATTVLPDLQALADDLLARKHGITRTSHPERARELLGDRLAAFLAVPAPAGDADADGPRGSDAAGAHVAGAGEVPAGGAAPGSAAGPGRVPSTASADTGSAPGPRSAPPPAAPPAGGGVDPAPPPNRLPSPRTLAALLADLEAL